MIILGLDALDFEMVKKFNCENLMQTSYGKTDISDFNAERTVVLWASFLTGINMEKEIPIKGQWKFKLPMEKTFFRFFNTFKAIDVPAFCMKQNNHEIERKLLAGFFKEENTVDEYDRVVWKNHEENKKEFLEEIGRSDILMGYFDLADAIGHLSFGIEEKMKRVYEELNELAGIVIKNYDGTVLIISDHGMKAVGRFGDHTKNGFFSFNEKIALTNPKIVDFFDIIKSKGEEGVTKD